MKVAVLPSALVLMLPETGTTPLVRVMFAVVSDVGSIGSLKTIVTAVLVAIPVAADAGTTVSTVGGVGSIGSAVVNVHVKSDASAFPEASFTPVMTEAV